MAVAAGGRGDEGTDVPEESGASVCEGTTAAGRACAIRALPGSGRRCHLHAGLAPTEAHVRAARANARKHGLFAASLPKEKRGKLRRARGRVEDKVQLAKDIAAYHLFRVEEAVEHEARTGQPLPATTGALRELRRALAEVPEEADPGAIDHVEVARAAEAVFADPRVFLKRLRPEVAAEVEAVLRKAGVLPEGG